MTMQFTFTGWAFWAAFAAVLLVLSGWKRVTPKRWHRAEVRQGLLLAFSLGFYALVGRQLVGLLVGSILVNHLLTRAMWSQEGMLRRVLLGTGIAFHLGVLGVFKYAYFVADLFPGSPLQGTCTRGVWTNGCFRWASPFTRSKPSATSWMCTVAPWPVRLPAFSGHVHHLLPAAGGGPHRSGEAIPSPIAIQALDVQPGRRCPARPAHSRRVFEEARARRFGGCVVGRPGV